ncbi:AI-2E family transporter [Engelhardtia mirabilis]|uniref:AI-2 transport protein TqsA n=1 Tax=Engelhardtia mirabilis TaxID=2528011 RepID=A0A518BKA3_9BACT|nr:AI-2 transport protein TqsA [Planctomycetes bacterium Pla133]QDV01733.1 AI-2 transport protein TqsA [Planctomycetes bacterium Pla86]
MLENLSRTRRNVALGIVATVVLLFAWYIRSVLNPLLLGYLLAFILQPVVRKLTDRGMKRTGAVVSVFALAFVVATVLGLGVLHQGRSLIVDVLAPKDGEGRAARSEAARGDQAADETEFELTQDESAGVDAPEEVATAKGEAAARMAAGEKPVDAHRSPESDSPSAGEAEETGVQSLQRVRDWAAKVLGDEWVPASVPSQKELVGILSEFAAENEGAVQAAGEVGARAAESIFAYIQRFFGGFLGLSTLVILVPVYAFFWLFEIERLNEYLASRFPRRQRHRLTKTFEKLGEVLSVFFRGRLLVSLLKGLFLTVALALAGVPYALLLGLGGGFLSIVPFIGGLVSFALALVVALSSHGLVYALLATGGIFAAAELLEGYVLLPRILGESLGLSDVAVLFAVTAGGAALGLFGVLVALPLAAVIKICWMEFVEPALDQFAEEESKFDAG